jgi:N6-L-threonylcarbamoyladenine synthase
MLILGIETSCDETAVALLKDGKQLLSNIVASQVDLHQEFGGVVPEVAARAHTEKMIPLLNHALKEAKVEPKDIDVIAVTYGPGLIGSLLVGTSTAKALAYSLSKKVIPINHVEAHLYGSWLNTNSPPQFPVVGLVVSGGHTELVLMKNHGDYELLGATLDDAAGEAFDKVAKLLGLGYPGGPAISKEAEKGNPKAFDLPRPMIKQDNFDFSFAGLKTAVLYLTKKGKVNKENMAASFQKAIVDVLVEKSVRAIKKYHPKSFILGGGVAANSELRKEMEERISPLTKLYIPEIKFCTDNAAIVAMNGYFRKEKVIDWEKLGTDPVAEIGD